MLVGDAVATTLAKLGARGTETAQGHSGHWPRRFKKQRHVLTSCAQRVARVPFKAEQRLAFGSAAELYDSIRPTYPSERRAGWSVTHRGESSSSALEPGSSPASSSIGSQGRRDRADAEMEARLLARSPGVETCRGEAEAIPLPDASVDAVVCAQAHWWFDPERACREIARVIRERRFRGDLERSRPSRNPLAAELNAIEGGAPVDVPFPRWALIFRHSKQRHSPTRRPTRTRRLFRLSRVVPPSPPPPSFSKEIARAVARLATPCPTHSRLPYLAVARRAVRLDLRRQSINPSRCRANGGALRPSFARRLCNYVLFLWMARWWLHGRSLGSPRRPS